MPAKTKTPAPTPPPEDPAVERGERIETGKNIARGGKTTGNVPGATQQPTETEKRHEQQRDEN